MRRISSSFLFVVLLVTAGVTRVSASDSVAPQLQRFARTEYLMGVDFRIDLYASSEMDAARAFKAAFSRIADLDRCMSNYRADSELSLLCTNTTKNMSTKVSEDLWKVLVYANRISYLSNGAFDVTIGRVTKLWRRARRRKEIPSEQRLAEELEFVGFEKLILNPADQSVMIRTPGLLIDLGAIGKGYAADEAMRILEDLGITRAVVNASGDVRFGAPPPDSTGWPTGIGALSAAGPPILLQSQSQGAVATSGDAFQFLEINGKRYSHILDPRSGMPVQVRSSVSVWAATGMAADALASAVSVLGPRRGLRLVRKLDGVEALVIWDRDGDGTGAMFRSRGFPLEK
ncbi:MAG: FAD:protein FMN transferase [Planctomycetaceae bacterium]|jgi:FAD:protein FMN transferase|nr:FAD:protein FMN transferase [Planctomycetaceae bacterium]MBT4724477.1 FAD:protein FMN transferase [Planctomycetaceae bacterium]MBT5124206.1 FAD:protein FMN transferase [Planctomycetaceae bacterium]MBT7253444.1 FAD:protein FMN transferase [Planctomycetaceae bacterium]MBT7918035.1 FAD:protein FMN transferase [Planctomycetaceae bacterium]